MNENVFIGKEYVRNLRKSELEKYCKENNITLVGEQENLILHILEFEDIDRFRFRSRGLTFALNVAECFIKPEVYESGHRPYSEK